MHLPHFLNLIQVHNKARLIGVVFLDALSAKDCRVHRAVEVLHALGVLLAQLFAEGFFILVFEVESGLREHWVFLNNLVQNVNVEGKSFCGLQILDKFAADWASNTVLMVQLLNAASAERVSAVDQDSRDALTHIVLKRTKLANVKPPGFVVEILNACSRLLIGCLH